MKYSAQSYILLASFCLLLQTGCTAKAVRFAPAGGDLADAMGPENSMVTTQQNLRTLVVTMTDAAHWELTGGLPINMVAADEHINPLGKYHRFLRQLQLDYGISRVADWPLKSLGVRCFVFEITGTQSREWVIEALQQDPRIETVQMMQKFYTLASDYNDPYVEMQHNLQTLAIPKSHSWATGKGVTIAIIDTGVDVDHEELSDQIDVKKNFVDNDKKAFNNDLHGTAIAGIIAAKTNNASGMVGIAPDARIVPLKACWQTQADSIKGACSSFTLAKSLNFAITNNIELINLSLAGPPDPLLERLVKKALENHFIVVAAVSTNRQHSFPSAISGVISVNETAKATTKHNNAELMAPGQKILSTKPSDKYDFYSGSSFSTAQVTGLIALIKERKPHLSTESIQSLLQATQIKNRSLQKQQTVSACRALARLVGTDCNE